MEKSFNQNNWLHSKVHLSADLRVKRFLELPPIWQMNLADALTNCLPNITGICNRPFEIRQEYYGGRRLTL